MKSLAINMLIATPIALLFGHAVYLLITSQLDPPHHAAPPCPPSYDAHGMRCAEAKRKPRAPVDFPPVCSMDEHGFVTCVDDYSPPCTCTESAAGYSINCTREPASLDEAFGPCVDELQP